MSLVRVSVVWKSNRSGDGLIAFYDRKPAYPSKVGQLHSSGAAGGNGAVSSKMGTECQQSKSGDRQLPARGDKFLFPHLRWRQQIAGIGITSA